MTIFRDESDSRLDGDPADFPHREAAMAEYRALWIQFLSGVSQEQLGRPSPVEASQKRMDELQSLISHGPGKVWREFRATLPGFVEWWGGMEGAVDAVLRVKFPTPPHTKN